MSYTPVTVLFDMSTRHLRVKNAHERDIRYVNGDKNRPLDFLRKLTKDENDLLESLGRGSTIMVDDDDNVVEVKAIPRPKVAPKTITRPQLLPYLTDAQEAEITGVVNGLPDGTPEEAEVKRVYQIWWENAYFFDKDNERVLAVAALLGWDVEEVWLGASAL